MIVYLPNLKFINLLNKVLIFNKLGRLEYINVQ